MRNYLGKYRAKNLKGLLVPLQGRAVLITSVPNWFA